jgi:protoporphyrinogen oxidase
VTRLQSLDDRITAVEYEEAGRRQRIATPAVVNTLPITVVVRMMDPPPPEPVLAAARQLRFRHVALAVLCLDQPSISDAACLYFPDPTLPFSRAHEPRNRSPVMSPPGKTSLVVEFPCFEEDPVWTRDDTTLTGEVVQTLDRMGLIRRAKVGGATVTRLRNAYPVYSRHYPALAGAVLGHLGRFENLQTLGRGGGFFYGHVHDFISLGFQAATAASKALTAGA